MIELALIAILALFQSGQDDPLARADKLYADRDNIESLRQAVLLAEQVAGKGQTNFEAMWRLAKLKYHLADRETDEKAKTKLLQAAIDAGKKAVDANGRRVEGHFWLAAAAGSYADLKGAFQSLGLVASIRREFEAALAIDPSYENGDGYSALGQMDLRLPKLLGGNEKRGLERLEKGLQVSPANSDLKVTLAEVYMKKGRKDEARKLLEAVLATNDPARSPLEQAELKAKAGRLLEKAK